MSHEQLIAHGELVRDAADRLCDAAENLARLANGIQCTDLPAPTAYRVLGNLKVLAWHLGEVIEYAPRGLVASLSNPAITITDSTFDGAPRDPRESVDHANAALATLREALAQAAVAADAAQSALGGQGYEPAAQKQVEGSAH